MSSPTQAATAVAALRRQAEALANDLSSRYTVELVFPHGIADRALWFHRGTARQPARPVFALDGRARRAAAERMGVRFVAASTQRINVLATITIGAQAVREVWVERLSNSGADMALAPLSLSWAQTKRRRGLDPRIGVATGEMLAAVRSAQLIVRKM